MYIEQACPCSEEKGGITEESRNFEGLNLLFLSETTEKQRQKMKFQVHESFHFGFELVCVVGGVGTRVSLGIAPLLWTFASTINTTAIAELVAAGHTISIIH